MCDFFFCFSYETVLHKIVLILLPSMDWWYTEELLISLYFASVGIKCEIDWKSMILSDHILVCRVKPLSNLSSIKIDHFCRSFKFDRYGFEWIKSAIATSLMIFNEKFNLKCFHLTNYQKFPLIFTFTYSITRRIN